MTDYISREALLSKCSDIWDNADETTQTGVDTINAIDIITDFIESLPAVDVQPVKYAKWILIDKDDVGRVFYCSNCHKVTTTDDFVNSPLEREEYFCPRCGAKMIKDGDIND